MSAATPEPPWYRQVWPWLLMIMPALALVGGGITYWLAATTNNALVVDDYYREGKAINQQLARDRAAVALGLSGELVRGANDAPELRLTATHPAALPPALVLRLVHATRAELDRTIPMTAAGDGRYVAPDARLPAEGRWNVHLEDPGRAWRLLGVSTGFREPVRFGEDRR
jgi:hypothetical protein